MAETPRISLERPQLERVMVTARDQITGKSKSITIYGVTPEQVIELLRAHDQQPVPAGAQQDPQSAPAPQ